jgi:hypothetical protein
MLRVFLNKIKVFFSEYIREKVIKMIKKGEDLRGANLENMDISDEDFAKADNHIKGTSIMGQGSKTLTEAKLTLRVLTSKV